MPSRLEQFQALAARQPENQLFRFSLAQALEAERAADILEEMDPDDAADLLAELPPDQAADLLDQLRDR